MHSCNNRGIYVNESFTQTHYCQSAVKRYEETYFGWTIIQRAATSNVSPDCAQTCSNQHPNHIEKLQRQATRLANGFHSLLYEQRRQNRGLAQLSH